MRCLPTQSVHSDRGLPNTKERRHLSDLSCHMPVYYRRPKPPLPTTSFTSTEQGSPISPVTVFSCQAGPSASRIHSCLLPTPLESPDTHLPLSRPHILEVSSFLSRNTTTMRQLTYRQITPRACMIPFLGVAHSNAWDLGASVP